jgi:hypothetical protein
MSEHLADCSESYRQGEEAGIARAVAFLRKKAGSEFVQRLFDGGASEKALCISADEIERGFERGDDLRNDPYVANEEDLRAWSERSREKDPCDGFLEKLCEQCLGEACINSCTTKACEGGPCPGCCPACGGNGWRNGVKRALRSLIAEPRPTSKGEVAECEEPWFTCVCKPGTVTLGRRRPVE